MRREQRLADQVALVTGSTAGLGATIARRFAAEGAWVVVTGRDTDRGAAMAAECNTLGPGAAFIPTDLTDEGATTAMVGAAVSRFGRLSVVVNNAVACDSLGEDGPVGELSTAAWEAIFRVNATAAFWVCRAAVHHLSEAGGGSILNVSSRAASRATPNLAAYAASKGALEALTRSVATDYAPQGIRCNALAPGYVLHEGRDADLTDERRAQLEAMHLTRLSTPDDVASAAVWLASDEAETITGIVLPIDGGSSTTARTATFG
jgi:NAD(P)-dependent dehydrogenase (short-subunit alcohol dehydrogenase family)